ncbi:hypothetical protein VTH06DRAFT_3226 [Thermothelomyces fergusii]
MGRKEKIAGSIVRAITQTNEVQKGPRSLLASILAFLTAFFSLYDLVLRKIRPADYARLRQQHWGINDNDYMQSFQQEDGDEAGKSPLKAIGDMGFSGSTFYSTADEKYLVKSLPRHSEHSFFSEDLMTPYVGYMASHPSSLLVRILGFLAVTGPSIGRVLRCAPSHHIVMDNIMHGREKAKEKGEAAWETWDLKPTSYFYPERDIAGGALTSDATKKKLADEFHDRIVLHREQAEDFFASLDQDTRLLAEYNAVDYSLFLVRMKAPRREGAPAHPRQTESGPAVVPARPPSGSPTPPSWRTGVASADGKYIFRASILDFFWAKHKVHAKAMTVLIKLWNVLISRHGNMSITTTPDEYRQRFLNMCRDMVEIIDE